MLLHLVFDLYAVIKIGTYILAVQDEVTNLVGTLLQVALT